MGKTDKIIYEYTYQGQMFDHWPVVYNRVRKFNAGASLDSDLFYIERNEFNTLLKKTLIRVENSRKEFIQEIIPFFKQNQSFDRYYEDMKVLVSISY